jgi:hypothetical protein
VTEVIFGLMFRGQATSEHALWVLNRPILRTVTKAGSETYNKWPAGGWYLCGLAELEESNDRQHQKLIEFYHGNRKKAAGLLSYGDAGGVAPLLISGTIIADRTYCESINSICRTVFGRKDCKYMLRAEFSGFVAHSMPAVPNIPTFKQFMDTDQPEHIFLSSEIRFSFTST